MKIALLGYGKMGQMIETVARKRPVEIVATIESGQEITKESLAGADVCIDFTHADAFLENVAKVCDAGCDLVVGTTGWDSHYDSVKALVEQAGIGCLHSANFSIGMQIMYKLVRAASHIFNKVEGYDVAALDIHHRKKADAPSGSSIELAKILLSELDGKEKAIYTRPERELMPQELHIASLRCGHMPGSHKVIFDSVSDTIELSYTARSRENYAVGALLAAEWIHGKKGMHEMDELIEELLK